MAVHAHQNPLRTSRLENIPYIFLKSNWQDVLSKLEKIGFWGAIVGPHGSGKTCMLEELKLKLAEQGFRPGLVRLSSQRSTFNRRERELIRESEIVMLDGAEQLNWSHWQILRARLRKKRGLIITTHKPGRLPTVYSCDTSPALLNLIAKQLGFNKALNDFELEQLLHRHNGDIRNALGELYLHFACK